MQSSATVETYTAILLYPDYATGNYGQDTWMDTVEAESPAEALEQARDKCIVDNGGEEFVSDRADLYCIALIKGRHDDVKPPE